MSLCASFASAPVNILTAELINWSNMPLIDQFGNKLAAVRAPSFDVKIIASRRQVILEQDQDLYRLILLW